MRSCRRRRHDEGRVEGCMEGESHASVPIGDWIWCWESADYFDAEVESIKVRLDSEMFSFLRAQNWAFL